MSTKSTTSTTSTTSNKTNLLRGMLLGGAPAPSTITNETAPLAHVFLGKPVTQSRGLIDLRGRTGVVAECIVDEMGATHCRMTGGTGEHVGSDGEWWCPADMLSLSTPVDVTIVTPPQSETASAHKAAAEARVAAEAAAKKAGKPPTKKEQKAAARAAASATKAAEIAARQANLDDDSDDEEGEDEDEDGDTAPASGASATVRKARPFAHREVGAMVRVSNILSATASRFDKTSKLCNEPTRIAIAALQSTLRDMAKAVDEHVTSTVAVRATDWKRAPGERPAPASKEIAPGASVGVRAKFAAEFEGLIPEGATLTVKRVVGSNVVVIVTAASDDSRDETPGTMVIARRHLTTV